MSLIVAPRPRPGRRDAAVRAEVVVQRLTDREPWRGTLLYWPPASEPHRKAKVTRHVLHSSEGKTFQVDPRFVHLATRRLRATLTAPDVRIQPFDHEPTCVPQGALT